MKNILSTKEKAEMKKSLVNLQDSTRDDYLKLAANFYEKRLSGEPPSPKRIRDALRRCSVEYRPQYWSRLRNAIMYDQMSKGYFENAALINTTYNPVTKPKTGVDRAISESVGGKAGKQQRRLKGLSEADLVKLREEVVKREDTEVLAALNIAKLTGARPTEFLNIKCLENGSIFIEGAKKGKEEKRGLDRYIHISDENFEVVKGALEVLKSADSGKAGVIAKIQNRLDTATKAAFPRRKTRPTLYTFRYEMGSELKASGLSRREISYIMGHQSMQSIDRYGNRRSGSGGTPIKPAPGADMSGVKEGYKEPFQKSKSIKKVRKHESGLSM